MEYDKIFMGFDPGFTPSFWDRFLMFIGLKKNVWDKNIVTFVNTETKLDVAGVESAIRQLKNTSYSLVKGIWYNCSKELLLRALEVTEDTNPPYRSLGAFYGIPMMTSQLIPKGKAALVGPNGNIIHLFKID